MVLTITWGEMPVPKEHGAWALVYGPLAGATLAFGVLDARLALLFLAATAFFVSHEPLARLARLAPQAAASERRARWKAWAFAYIGAGVLAGVCLIQFWALPLLPWMAAAIGPLFALHLRFVARRSERETAGELLGVFGLTATAPVTYYVFQQRLDWLALGFWVLNLLYFASGIFFVKMTVSRHVGKTEAARRVRDCLGYHLLLLPLAAAVGLTMGKPVTAAAAMTPIVARALIGIWRPPARLSLKRVGYREVIFTILFVGVLGLGFRFDWM